MSKKAKILLVEDDVSFGKILRDYLSLNQLEVTHSKDGIDGWNTFRNHHFDLCVLDVMMPKRDGVELAGMIRQNNKRVPIVFLTARGKKEDMLNGFETGADDYLVKPVDADILLMKIRALLKRSMESDIGEQALPVHFCIGSFTFNYETRVLERPDEKHILSPKEADVLQQLCMHINQLVRRDELLRALWKEVNYFTGRSLDVYIARLRKYLQTDSSITLNSLPKSGYILEVRTMA